jgi:alpha,alpha-trehalase
MDVKEIFLSGELFNTVQMQSIFPDGKTFVDCTPRLELSSILQRYDAEKSNPGFDLGDFVQGNFMLPETYSTSYVSAAERPITQHLELLWDELTRQPSAAKNSLIPLPYPYIVPGGRFREIYYWDSYFTMLGLQVSGRIDMIKNMVDNFSYLIHHTGYVPNGNRTYFLGRSQPPFYSSMVQLLSEVSGKNILIDYLPQLEKEYNFWMKGTDRLSTANPSLHRVVLLDEGIVLNRYWDESDTPRPESFKEDVELAKDVVDKKQLYRNLRAACESGWDFSSRWFKNGDFSTIHTTEIIPVDLNCLLLNLENTLAEGYQLANDSSSAEKYQIAAGKRKEAINKYCWNKSLGCYFDYDHIAGKHKQSLTLAIVYPLFFNIASADQAAAVTKVLQEQFLSPGGLRTTTVDTGQQWDSPNGWAPLHWLAVKGLINYGHHTLAKDIATRWMNINEKVYHNTGKMMEKYNVVATNLEAGGGEYPAQDGFGWTNGVYLRLKNP